MRIRQNPPPGFEQVNLDEMKYTPVPLPVVKVETGFEPERREEAQTWITVGRGAPIPVKVWTEINPDNPKQARLRFEPIVEEDESIKDVEGFIDDVLGEPTEYDSVENVRELLASIDKDLASHVNEENDGADADWLNNITAAEMVGGGILGARRLKGTVIKKALGYEPASSTIRADVQPGEDGKPEAVLEVYEFDEAPVVTGLLKHIPSRREKQDHPHLH